MQVDKSSTVKISARVPKNTLNHLSRLYPRLNLSEIIRTMAEGELRRKKALKLHMKLYGKFKLKDLDESLL